MKMTVLAYIIASIIRGYRFRKEARRLENIVRAARFAYKDKANAISTCSKSRSFNTASAQRQKARGYAGIRRARSSIWGLEIVPI